MTGSGLREQELPLSAILSRPRSARWLAGAYALMVLLGIVAFRLPGATVRGNEMSFERATFTAVNAATLTGFQQAVALDEYGTTGKTAILLLTVGGTLFTLMLGGLGLTRALRLPYSDRQIIIATLVTFSLAVAWGTALIAEPTRNLLASASQSASALGNSGLYLGRLPGVIDWRTHAALLPLAVVGGLSIPVVLELLDSIFRRGELSTHTRVVLTLSAVVYLIGVLMMMPWEHVASRYGGDWIATIATGSTLSIDSRSAGFPLAIVNAMSRPAQWLLMLLMLIGAAPGGAGGGVKVTSAFHLTRGIRRLMTRQPGNRSSGIAILWITIYLAIILAVVLALLATLPELPADKVVFLAVSAVGLVGLSHDPISFSGGGLFVLSIAMLIGRAAPLIVLWWTARTTDDTDVAVG
jgi:trk system potassium uptake protein TrkH